MKKSSDPRHLKRKKIIQELFALSFCPQKVNQPTTRQVAGDFKKIDQIIIQAAPAFPVNKIAKIDSSILRLAIFEIRQKTAPPKVIVNEAVELAKEFGGEKSSSFINGVLGTVLKTYGSN